MIESLSIMDLKRFAVFSGSDAIEWISLHEASLMVLDYSLSEGCTRIEVSTPELSPSLALSTHGRIVENDHVVELV